MKHPHHRLLTILCCVIALAVPAYASAQEFQTEFQVERFEPLPAQGTNILNTAKSDVVQHLLPSAGLFFHYQSKPLTLVDQKTKSEEILVGAQLRGEVWASFGLFDIVDLGLVMPLVLYQNGKDSEKVTKKKVEGIAFSDLRIVPKVRIINPDWAAGFGVAAMASVFIPIKKSPYNSDGEVRVEPRLVIDWRHSSGFAVATNLTYAMRPIRNLKNFVTSDIFRWNVGLEVPLGLDWLKLIGTVFGDVQILETDIQKGIKLNYPQLAKTNNQPMEWDAGLQFQLPYNLIAQVGGGTGIPNGSVGAPEFRVFASFGYTPTAPDSDGDGIPDSEDQCPDEPEDFDGFEDHDGCPDPDNDGDGVLDVNDKCPNEPGPIENQGCPWGDRDGDGVPDNVDNCPDEPGKPEDNGCPLYDSDNDGILDGQDKCPNDPEDFDGFQDEDGCPDLDNDGDGIPDTQDKCPNEPEDYDGFQDEDGCPDPDNDGDGIPDIEDKCPNEPETINGIDDDDGCPDKGETKVRITKTKIEILEKVFFATGKSTIRSRSYNLLDQVASVLKNNKQITSVRIEGHTDSVGSARKNMRLSQDRADAVRSYLIDRGVSPDRLVAKGYGEDDPIDTNKTKAGRERNRRVEFTIATVNGKPVDTKSVTIQEKEVIR